MNPQKGIRCGSGPGPRTGSSGVPPDRCEGEGPGRSTGHRRRPGGELHRRRPGARGKGRGWETASRGMEARSTGLDHPGPRSAPPPGERPLFRSIPAVHDGGGRFVSTAAAGLNPVLRVPRSVRTPRPPWVDRVGTGGVPASAPCRRGSRCRGRDRGTPPVTGMRRSAEPRGPGKATRQGRRAGKKGNRQVPTSPYLALSWSQYGSFIRRSRPAFIVARRAVSSFRTAIPYSSLVSIS